MSSRAFKEALVDFLCGPLSFPISYEEARRSVFDRWLADGRHEELVRYMVEELLDSAGRCHEEYLRVLSEDLARIGRPDLIRKLYQPLIDVQRDTHFLYRADF